MVITLPNVKDMLINSVQPHTASCVSHDMILCGMEKTMNHALKKKTGLEILLRESKNSTHIMHRALSDVSKQYGSSKVDVEKVRRRIKEIVESKDRKIAS